MLFRKRFVKDWNNVDIVRSAVEPVKRNYSIRPNWTNVKPAYLRVYSVYVGAIVSTSSIVTSIAKENHLAFVSTNTT